eukprot:jgi/Hompol1/1069/HPOL_001173-RA
MLGRVKLSFPEIREALLQMQEDKISETLIKQLQLNKPAPEDIELIKEHIGNSESKINELGKAEQFLWEVNKVPRLDQRLIALNYKLKFQDRMQENKPQIEAIMEASMQLKDNKKITKLLQVILAIGNYMNADSSAKSGAYGFTLDSIIKLVDVKSADRKTSLLNYIVSTIDQKFPDLVDLGLNSGILEKASKLSLVALSQEVNELARGMEGLDREAKQPDTGVKGDKLKQYIENFLKSHKAELDSMVELQKKTEEVFKKVIEYYGEDSSATPAFFAIFSTFLGQVDKARKENIKLEVMKSKPTDKASRLAEKEQEKRILKENVSKVINSDNKQIMDDLISSLKTGTHYKGGSTQHGSGTLRGPPQTAIKPQLPTIPSTPHRSMAPPPIPATPAAAAAAHRSMAPPPIPAKPKMS